jgi:23S rRNA pseudouridine2605 synthase
MPARSDNFQKFVKQKKGSAIKEDLKQQKRKEKREKAAAIEAHFERKRAERQQKQPPAPPAAPSKTGRPNKYPKKEVDIAALNAVADTPEKSKLSTIKNTATKSASGKKAPVKGNTPQAYSERGAVEQMPLNKYVAHGGLCSRRDAAIWVKEGKVTVNGTVATDPGMKVFPTDDIKVGNKKVIPSKNFVYILLNKPKDYITTSEDPQGRKTVLDLVRTATDERVYPVGRLDRNTSGVLLLTNDGDLAQKLSHPKHEVKKVYEVRLDRVLTKGDMDKIASGVTLEDGFVAPDVIAYADSKDKSIIGVEIHSGRNRIVRRIFEYMKYDVKGLDRVMFAGLTKKDVQRGRWRLLKEKEIRLLKFMNQSFVKVRD